MTLRLSTVMLHRQGVENMQRQQSLLAQTQNEIASGRRNQTAASNPAEWAAAARLDQTLAAIAGYEANAGTVADRLGFEETALASAGDILARARELAVQVNSAALSSSDRGILANQLRQLQQELLAVANTQNADGEFLFSGSVQGSAPFALAAGVASYSGNSSARLLDLSSHRQIADGDSGDRVFMALPNGNGTFAVATVIGTGTASVSSTGITDISQWDGGSYTLSYNSGSYEVRDVGNALVTSGTYSPDTSIGFRGIQLTLSGTPADGDRFSLAPSTSQDVFATLQKLLAFAEAPVTTAAQRAQNQTLYFGALQELETAQTHFSDLRGSVGARLAAVEDSQAALSAQSLLAQQHLSDLRDLDYAEAASRLSLQQTLLQAAQLSYQRVQGLSLFDYLR